jgi:hypothetical protein
MVSISLSRWAVLTKMAMRCHRPYTIGLQSEVLQPYRSTGLLGLGKANARSAPCQSAARREPSRTSLELLIAQDAMMFATICERDLYPREGRPG